MSMHKQCEFFAHSVQYNPRDDTSFASWGSMLMHLSMVCEQQVLSQRPSTGEAHAEHQFVLRSRCDQLLAAPRACANRGIIATG